jgi:uncharacterized membrane protein YfcA
VDHVAVAIAALVVSGLTLFSGFGVNTLLLPVFFWVFTGRPEVAVAAAGVVHLLNNGFKFTLLGKHTRWKTALIFGIPAVVAAWFGARMLHRLSEQQPWFTYELFGKTREVLPVYLLIGVLMAVFALFDLVPKLRDLRVQRRYLLPVGGVLSGFFGGLSGHQGALRSTFLIKTGLTKEQFIATGVVISLFVDCTRITTYLSEVATRSALRNSVWLLVTATLATFAGALIARRLLKTVTIGVVRTIVGVLLLLIAVGLAAGLFAK